MRPTTTSTWPSASSAMATAAEALTELAQCLRLRPNDSEAQAVQKAWTKPDKPAVARPALPSRERARQPPRGRSRTRRRDWTRTPSADPLERIERSFDAAAFHQAALMLDQMEAARLAALPPRSARKSSPPRRMSTWTTACCWRPSGSISPPWPPTPSPPRPTPAWPRFASAPATPRLPARRPLPRWN